MEQLQVKLTELHNVVNEIDQKTKAKAKARDLVMVIIKDLELEKKKFSIGNRLIRYNLNKIPGGLSQAYVKKALKEFHENDQDLAIEVAQYIIGNRPVVERESIEITKKKPKVDEADENDPDVNIGQAPSSMELLQLKLTELHNVVNEIDQKNEQKAALREELMVIIKDNELEKKKFSIGNRYIRYKLTKSQSAITQGYLLNALKEFHENDQELATDTYQYIIDNRPVTEKESIEISKKPDKK